MHLLFIFWCWRRLWGHSVAVKPSACLWPDLLPTPWTALGSPPTAPAAVLFAASVVSPPSPCPQLSSLTGTSWNTWGFGSLLQWTAHGPGPGREAQRLPSLETECFLYFSSPLLFVVLLMAIRGANKSFTPPCLFVFLTLLDYS